MENFICKEIDFEDAHLQALVVELRLCYKHNNENFVKLCSTIYKIWDYCHNSYCYSTDGKRYKAKELLGLFGFDGTSINRYKRCYERYIGFNGMCNAIKLTYEGFTPSKLFEMLTLEESVLKSYIKQGSIYPEMTVKEIREFIKGLQKVDGQAETLVEAATEINEADIPSAYDPTQKYDYSYFETKTKNQLLNIVWELQKAYQKLKSQKNKLLQ